MARFRSYVDGLDVLTAARARIRRIFDLHDVVAVCFSGGKDSLCTLHLVWEEAQRRGQSQVHVVFRDEELIPSSVLDFVDHYRQLPWVAMRWFTIPLQASRFLLGQRLPYVQWDPARAPGRWARSKPAHGINLAAGDTRIFDQHTTDAFVCEHLPPAGRVALCTGIRAAESLARFRACVNKLNDNYINASPYRRATLCKPIYDWSEHDVFRFFYEQQIRYCPVYDQQLWAGDALRVSTPFSPERAKLLDRLRSVDPMFFEQATRVFPDMLVQARYWSEWPRGALEREYGQDFAGVARYIDEVLEDPDVQTVARAALTRILVKAQARPQGYPPPHVFRWIEGGAYNRPLNPMRADEAAVVRQRQARLAREEA